jgi:hypothetical protein
MFLMRNKYFDEDAGHFYLIVKSDTMKYSSITNEASDHNSRKGHWPLQSDAEASILSLIMPWKRIGFM